jgi:DNA topoisomerase-2
MQLHKYKSIVEVIDDYYLVRMDMYRKRKEAMLRNMEAKVQEMNNRAKFISEVVNNTIDLRKMLDDEDTDQLLTSKQYDKIDDKYDYLTRMPMHNMNKQRVQKIIQDKDEVVKELQILKNTQLTTMWLLELQKFEDEYMKYKQSREKIVNSVPQKVLKKSKK